MASRLSARGQLSLLFLLNVFTLSYVLCLHLLSSGKIVYDGGSTIEITTTARVGHARVVWVPCGRQSAVGHVDMFKGHDRHP